jgi:hypothetical protein
MPIKQTQRVSRYNLTIVFEEPYTRDPAQLESSATMIGEIISAIQQTIIADKALQARLATQNLQIHMIAPERIAPRRGLPRSQEV